MGDSSSSSDSENDIVPSSTTGAVVPEQGKEQRRAPRAPRRTHSVAHADFESKKIILFNVDLETGGDSCGPVQISVAAYNPHEKRSLSEFDAYIRPAKGALWSQATINVHGIQPTQQRIKEADELEEVWQKLLEYFREAS
jgi:DNA polymerase III alpha subunit (gram-positive type)